MSDILAEQYAQEAHRLLNDDTLLEALTRIQKAAVAELLAVNADDKTSILRLQAKANMTTEILDELKTMILAAGEKTGGFDPNARKPE